MAIRAKILFYTFVFFALLTISNAVDTISANQTIRDGDIIFSAGENFELGIFTVSNSSENRYLAIRYRRLASGTVIWVANRETPITNTSGVLQLTIGGVLQLRNGSNGLVWSSSNSSGSARNPVARLLDTGNLVIRDENDRDPESYIWQSFDHPGDTFMPAMKFGRNLVRGTDTFFTSWRSLTDPSPGEYLVYMDYNGLPQIYVGRGSDILYRLGFWNGLRFTGLISLRPNPIFTFEFVFNDEETYYRFDLVNDSVITKMKLDVNGNMDRLNWIDRTQGWFLYSTPITDNCVRYDLCGAYGSCNIDDSPPCGCLEGFEPRNEDEWRIADWRSGCRRRVALDCGSGEGFRKYSDLKLPDSRNSWFNRTMTLDECETRCKSDCNCTAYSNLDISGEGSGCLLWFGELTDMRSFSDNGQEIYIRMAPSELEKGRMSSRRRRIRQIVIPIMTTVTLILGLCLLCAVRRRRLRKGRGEVARLEQELQDTEHHSYESHKNDLDLPLFSFSTLLAATDKFSIQNKLGEGGYGPVYKGVLEDGREIAVKRLSETSTQGIDEFKNEVIVVNKLQHRNLVKLLGCCIQGKEQMLVYEYMPNKSLDSYLFDKTRNKLLDWPMRFHIINGIARGLLYLHQDSRLRIIHRDLKAGNILLDIDMNAKISDFGMARSFGGNETEANTMKVVGTYGYMSPEYAGDGIFSVKSDVFSFGVLVLEILSGKKNRGFFSEDHHHNLLGHAWRLHREGRSMELVDPSISDSAHMFEVLRIIHVALLCVQQSPEDRPRMSSVVIMLSGEGKLPEPEQPGFYHESSRFGPEHSSSMIGTSSRSNTKVTQLQPR